MTQRVIFSSVLAIAIAGLAACSGGGGGGTPPVSSATAPPTHATSSPSATPTATPSPTSAPSVATASGTVVDFDSNSGLAGVTVAIASYSSTAAPVAVATTGPNGAFTFTAAPGSYLIEIGSNSATDTRATYHNKVTLTAGTNAIAQGVPSPEPDVTLAPSQASGNFRLAELSSTEQDCVSGANGGRQSNGFGEVVPDENAFEFTRGMSLEELAQSTDTPAPLFQAGYGYGDVGSIGFTTLDAQYTSSNLATLCDGYTNGYSFTNGNPPYQFATNPKVIWYAATLGAQSGSSNAYAVQTWLEDPR